MPCYKDEKQAHGTASFATLISPGNESRSVSAASKPNVKRKSGSANSICKKPRAVT